VTALHGRVCFDAGSRIGSIDSYVDGLTSFTHDNTDQLKTADHTGQTDESYSYDENGNRTMAGYVTTDNNQLTTDGVYNYTYDDEGNRLTRTVIGTGYVTEYEWDHRNRLTKLTEKDDSNNILSTVEFAYDVFNLRVAKIVDADGPGGNDPTETYFSWESNQIALQFDGDQASDLAHRYLHGPQIDHVLADEAVANLAAAGDLLWPLADHLGTVRDLAEYDTGTNATTIANHIEYDSYGNVTAETNAAVDHLFAFTGRDRDEETDLQYHRARYYDPATGRWIGEDPIGFSAGDSNLYRYIANTPIIATDPSGLWISHHPYDPDASWPRPYSPPLPPGDGRNKKNVAPPTEQEAIDLGFRLCPPAASRFHQPGKKYVGPDGRWEAVYDENGNLDTNPKTMGTYNYYDYEYEPIEHIICDVIPFFIWDYERDPGSPAPPKGQPIPPRRRPPLPSSPFEGFPYP